MGELGTNQKGAIAEAAIELAAIRLGIGVYKPKSGHSRADLVFEIGDELYRVQVKWARLAAAHDVVQIRTSGRRLTPAGYVRSHYTADEIDLLAAYCEELDRSFLLPTQLFVGRDMTQLRLTPARNNQRACINLAETYDFDGAVAQLARARDWQSRGRGFESPQLHSSDASPTTVGSDPFGKQVGYWMERAAAGEEVVVTFRGRPRVRLVPIAPELRAA